MEKRGDAALHRVSTIYKPFSSLILKQQESCFSSKWLLFPPLSQFFSILIYNGQFRPIQTKTLADSSGYITM